MFSFYLTGNIVRGATMLFREGSLLIMRTIRNTQIHSVDKMQNYSTLKQVVHIETTEL
jgi:hypothetical protein